MRCPECGSEKVVKDGKQRGKQTYLCKVCHRRFTPNATKLHRPSHVKQKDIELYINGMSINAISKVLNIPYMTVWTWINKAGQRADKKVMRELERLKKQGKVKAISIDEMWSYVGRKGNEVWIWSVVVELSDGSIKKFLFAGDRSLGTFLKDIGEVARS